MAKFHSYYVLCPLIDQKSFLGVSEDKEEEYVIVTLGRNVVNKYRLSDQKQVGGWTSKEHITSAVIYDKEQDSYVGIFNNNTIKIWKEDVDNLDKIKKYKFPVNMLKLIPRGDQPSLIVFANGNCASLPYAIDNRKTYESKSLIKNNEKIMDIACYTLNGTDNICYVVKNNKDHYEIINCLVRVELGDLDRSKLTKTKIQRSDDVYVVGVLICTVEKQLFVVYILWSDSKMTMYDLSNKSWKTIGSVPWISTFNSVSLAWMGKSHIIIFGSNTDQDGAIIVAYNVTLGVGSCRYPMKMYTQEAKLYCMNSRIILEASNHIAMLPYVLEVKRNLSKLLGSHEIMEDENTEIANWGTPKIPKFEVPEEIRDHFKLGITERTICAHVVLPLLEKNEVAHVLRIVKQFKDIPESVVVQLLNYILKMINTDVDVQNREKFVQYCSVLESKHMDKFELLNYLFQITFSDALLIPILRNELTLNSTLFLLSYISYLLVDSEMKMDSDYESKLLDWCTLLMDAFYQQYLMTKDEKVTYVLQNTLNIVVSLVKQLETVDESMALLNKFLSGKMTEEEETLPYSIEMMQI